MCHGSTFFSGIMYLKLVLGPGLESSCLVGICGRLGYLLPLCVCHLDHDQVVLDRGAPIVWRGFPGQAHVVTVPITHSEVDWSIRLT